MFACALEIRAREASRSRVGERYLVAAKVVCYVFGTAIEELEAAAGRVTIRSGEVEAKNGDNKHRSLRLTIQEVVVGDESCR